MWLMWNLILVYFMMVLVLEQDRCMVCAKCIIGLEIVLDTPDELQVMRLKWMLVSIYLEIVLILRHGAERTMGSFQSI
jgi:hypothetical protein